MSALRFDNSSALFNLFTMKFQKESAQSGRRKLLHWAAGAFSGLLLWRFTKKEEPVAKPARMLTQDGQLVEVDPRFLTSSRHKIDRKEMQTWIKRKS